MKSFILCTILLMVLVRFPSTRAIEEPRVEGSQVNKGKCGSKAVCIFNFLDTLYSFTPFPDRFVATQAREAVRRCQKLGYEIAVVAESSNKAYLEDVLQRRMNADIFNDKWMDSEALQYGVSNKPEAIRKILQHFGLDECPSCGVYMEETMEGKQISRKAGVHFVHVSPGHGLRKKDIGKAEELLSNTCFEKVK